MTDLDAICFNCTLPGGCYDEKGTPPVMIKALKELCPRAQAEKTRRRQRSSSGCNALPPGYLTAPDAARRLGVARKTVGEWCTRGKFPAARKLRHNGFTKAFWIIPEAAVKELVEGRQI